MRHELCYSNNEIKFVVNHLEKFTVEVDPSINCVTMDLKVNGENKKVTMIPFTVNILLENLKEIQHKMAQLNDPAVFL
jgi:hypothetical protein